MIDVLPNTQSGAYKRGYATGKTAHGASCENPYSKNTHHWEHKEWVMGWLDGCLQFVKERQEEKRLAMTT